MTDDSFEYTFFPARTPEWMGWLHAQDQLEALREVWRQRHKDGLPPDYELEERMCYWLEESIRHLKEFTRKYRPPWDAEGEEWKDK